MSERADKIKEMLQRTPDDPFLLYALGMEHKKAGNWREAIDQFNRTIEVDPGYCYAYHQRGLAYASAGDVAEARRSYEEGIAAAQKKGDAHAAEEIGAALEELE